MIILTLTQERPMLFPVSGVEVHPFIPFAAALIISFFTSMGGVSGAFLLLPFQVSILGYTAPSVSATNQVFNIVAIPSGVYRYIREGRMLWPLTFAVIIGTLPGVFIGAWIRVEYLPNPKAFKFFAAFILFYIGWRLAMDIIRNSNQKNTSVKSGQTLGYHTLHITTSTLKKVEFEFGGVIYGFSSTVVYLISFFVGIAGGIYGIGGGAIIAPFFVAIIGLPVYTVAGAVLFGTFVTSIAGVIFYHLLAQFYPGISISPDWQLGALFGIGGFIGMYLGARIQKFIPSKIIKGVLCACVVFTALKYIISFFF